MANCFHDSTAIRRVSDADFRQVSDGFPTGFRRLGRHGVSGEMVLEIQRLSDGFRRVSDGCGVTECRGKWFWRSNGYPTVSDGFPTGFRRVSGSFPTCFRRLSDGFPTVFDGFRQVSDRFPTGFRRPGSRGVSRQIGFKMLGRRIAISFFLIFFLTAIRRVSDGRGVAGRRFPCKPRPQEKCLRRLSDGYLTLFFFFFFAPFSV